MRDVFVVIEEMLAAIRAARACCADKTFEQFAADWMPRLASERALEIISEAARHLPEDVVNGHPGVPWRKVRAIGNVLRHEYHRIAPKVIWDVMTAELDPLEIALIAELAKRPAATGFIFKILRESEWAAAEAAGVYTGSAVDVKDGFIHFSTAAQAAETAAKHFAGQADLVLVRIEADALGDALKWEPSRGGAMFPHLYGTLPTRLATWVKPLPLGADDRHVFPDMDAA